MNKGCMQIRVKNNSRFSLQSKQCAIFYTTGSVSLIDNNIDRCLSNITKYNHRTRAFLKYKNKDHLVKESQNINQDSRYTLAVKANLVCGDEGWGTAGSPSLTLFSQALSNGLYVADVVRRARLNGAVLVGTTSMDEFGMGSTGGLGINNEAVVQYNQEGSDPECLLIAGGSSGGSAVAIQAGMANVALGSDTGGSVRLPAALCRIIGFKPAYNQLSRHGLIAYASSLDTVGILSNNIDTLQRTYYHMHSSCSTSSGSISQLSSIRIGYLNEGFSAVDEDMQKHLLAAIPSAVPRELLTETHVSLPLFSKGLGAYYVIASCESASNLARYFPISGQSTSDSNGMGKEVKTRVIVGRYLLSSSGGAYLKRAVKIRKAIIGNFNDLFNECDIIALPATPKMDITLAEWSKMAPSDHYRIDALTVPASLAGLPAIVVPLNPYPIQLLSAKNNEQHLFDIAKLLLRQKNTM